MYIKPIPRCHKLSSWLTAVSTTARLKLPIMTQKCLSNGSLLQYMDYKKPKTLTPAHLMERETNYPSSFKLYRCNSQQNFTFTFCNITYYQNSSCTRKRRRTMVGSYTRIQYNNRQQNNGSRRALIKVASVWYKAWHQQHRN